MKVLEGKNLQNQTISELYTYVNKSKYSTTKKNYEKTLHQEDTFKAATTKFLNRKKKSNEKFNICEAKIFLDEIIKSMKSQTNKWIFR